MGMALKETDVTGLAEPPFSIGSSYPQLLALNQLPTHHAVEALQVQRSMDNEACTVQVHTRLENTDECTKGVSLCGRFDSRPVVFDLAARETQLTTNGKRHSLGHVRSISRRGSNLISFVYATPFGSPEDHDAPSSPAMMSWGESRCHGVAGSRVSRCVFLVDSPTSY
ncbi:hypothetical protein CI102_7280 [Trichoderma harzianum]|uniref:Uncharacterized protein n=1 Tax=Trichoderma harzianum CBS 226.95 TaxID=983964 RepID=A0A2T3ZYM7_TRIHA|nr:hypothetical protein M431DRAFT_268996 [Trichoderma harzianum CBS 226.95]PKK47618.1 hypothetical protein CI102_7280 [Trichoderma harzianum]PTB49917.1 hypothetical protein M431DRAFT_268996 [Trichoderma harzianum CBS 226.95]